MVLVIQQRKVHSWKANEFQTILDPALVDQQVPGIGILLIRSWYLMFLIDWELKMARIVVSLDLSTVGEKSDNKRGLHVQFQLPKDLTKRTIQRGESSTKRNRKVSVLPMLL